MFLYNEDNERVRFRTSEDNFIDKGQYGSVYRVSTLACAKVYKNSPVEIDPEVLKTIRGLSLRNFYEIYDLLYTKGGKFKGYLMKYYDSFDIDILTMPTAYTLDNLYALRDAMAKLTSSNIWVVDLHEDNVILGESIMTVIDADLYTFNNFYSAEKLKVKNTKAINSLFFNIYILAINKYHQEYARYDISKSIIELFSAISEMDTFTMTKRLMKYKYPIDYLRACIKK